MLDGSDQIILFCAVFQLLVCNLDQCIREKHEDNKLKISSSDGALVPSAFVFVGS
jgi:hypothetical protein